MKSNKKEPPFGLLQSDYHKLEKAIIELHNNTTKEEIEEILKHIMYKQALKNDSLKDGWAFLYDIKNYLKYKNCVVDFNNIWQNIFDNAIEHFIEAKIKLEKMTAQQEARRLKIFLKRAGVLSQKEIISIAESEDICIPLKSKS